MGRPLHCQMRSESTAFAFDAKVREGNGFTLSGRESLRACVVKNPPLAVL